MNTPTHIKFDKNQLDKIGNTAVYLCNRIKNLSKARLLGLFYILDERSICKSGIPFLDLTYTVGQSGLNSTALFVDLASNSFFYLGDYIEEKHSEEMDYIMPLQEFYDDEFTENDIALLDQMIVELGDKSQQELEEHFANKIALWYHTAKDNRVFVNLKLQPNSPTGFVIDMSLLIADAPRKLLIYNGLRYYN
ncbi:hypothetical protein [Flavobacterium sp. NKUCC04_CG]|uniref:hypothetical protein n=1 Tax=Flavobacterium sp. NKUCC04_CG TaxID=2842121 RepID=UPI001C5B964C|nr:hypothetical protein [Flavobacterium sp. NKUCC04_CG]MBW3519977.1 hypothetical protein [Flavobacterium sp. NKUCC04_CG]